MFNFDFNDSCESEIISRYTSDTAGVMPAAALRIASFMARSILAELTVFHKICSSYYVTVGYYGIGACDKAMLIQVEAPSCNDFSHIEMLLSDFFQQVDQQLPIYEIEIVAKRVQPRNIQFNIPIP